MSLSCYGEEGEREGDDDCDLPGVDLGEDV